MKRLRVVALVGLLFALTHFASAQFSLGAKGGINFNSFRGDQNKESYEVVPGFNVGAFIRKPVLPFLTARAEVLYMQQGGNIHDYVVMSELNRRQARTAFHNVQIPIIAEFGLPSLNEDPLQPKLLLGGFYSYTIQARETYVNVAKIDGYDPIKYDGFSDVTDLFYRNQYGLIAGVAADVKVFNKPVSIEFRYNYNLSRANVSGTQNLLNMQATHEKWGNALYLSTLSINVGVTLLYF